MLEIFIYNHHQVPLLLSMDDFFCFNLWNNHMITYEFSLWGINAHIKTGLDKIIYHTPLFDFCRLSFCKVTQRGGSSLVSALDSNYCSLKDLDLSFNNLSQEIVKLLNEKKRDTCCSLENVKYGKKSCLKKNALCLIYYQFFSHFNIARSIIVLRKQQCFCLFFPLVWTTMKNVGSIWSYWDSVRKICSRNTACDVICVQVVIYILKYKNLF